MFNNLIESTSHTREFKRRGSFMLFTMATYALLFVIAGVASIYAYDARLEDQNTELIVTMLPPDLLPTERVQPARSAAPAKSNAGRPTEAVRQVAMASVNRPDVPPKGTSVEPNKNLPIPDRGTFIIGDRDSDPVVPSGNENPNGSRSSSITGGSTPNVDVGTPPPPVVPVRPPTPRIISKGVITGLALQLPKPAYPIIAKQARASGPVNVQVLIDEMGKVISAKAVSGNPMLLAAAQQAAYSARFSPTRLGDQAVKVSGVITYNFVLQ